MRWAGVSLPINCVIGRAKLAHLLILSLDAGEEEDNDRLWAEEAERRYQQIERGEVSAIPSQEVFREARARLK